VQRAAAAVYSNQGWKEDHRLLFEQRPDHPRKAFQNRYRLLRRGRLPLLWLKTPKVPVRLALPTPVAGYLFPDLYPTLIAR